MMARIAGVIGTTTFAHERRGAPQNCVGKPLGILGRN
jgi:hypothetical protein